MKYLHILFIVALFFFINYSCSNTSNTENKKVNAKQIISKTEKLLKFPLNSNTLSHTQAVRYYQKKNKKYCVYGSSKSHSIHFYNIETKKKEFSIQLEKDGPDGIPIFSGYWVNSFDSVYVTSKLVKTLFLINRQGKIINKYDYDILENGLGKLFNAYSYYNKFPVFIGNKIYITQKTDGSFNKINLSKNKICVEIDTSSKIAKALPASFPIDYLDDGFFSGNFSREWNGNEFIYSFDYSHYLYLTKDHVDVQKVLCKSDYIKKFIPESDKYDFNKVIKNQVESPKYLNIIYDPYRKLYYRVAYHGLDVKDGDDFHKLRMYYKNFSIIILDSKYNKIGETKFPPDKYYIGNIFIAPEGIYISENNPDNPNFDENFIQFRLFKINEN